MATNLLKSSARPGPILARRSKRQDQRAGVWKQQRPRATSPGAKRSGPTTNVSCSRLRSKARRYFL